MTKFQKWFLMIFFSFLISFEFSFFLLLQMKWNRDYDIKIKKEKIACSKFAYEFAFNLTSVPWEFFQLQDEFCTQLLKGNSLMDSFIKVQKDYHDSLSDLDLESLKKKSLFLLSINPKNRRAP